MEAQKFVDFLTNIGYNDAKNLSVDDIKWAFSYSNTKSFLQWFGSGLSKNNVLSTDELTQFNQLEQTGQVLSGAALQEALALLPDIKGSNESTPESLKNDIEQLKKSIDRMKQEKNVLMTRCSKLSNHKMELKNKIEQTEKEEQHNLITCGRMTESCKLADGAMGKCLSNLLKSVDNLTGLYEPKNKEQETAYFLTQNNLQSFYKAEEKFSHELTTFTKKHFFKGVSEVSGGNEKSYNLMDISSSATISGSEEEKADFQQDCEELQRLKNIFPKSEFNRLNALVDVERAKSAFQEARSILGQLQQNNFPLKSSEISHLQLDVEQSLEDAQFQTRDLNKAAVGIIKELGDYQGTEVLTGDYNLKLQRQDYFINNQEQVINYLVDQRSRNEFLAMMYELELQWHRKTHDILSVAKELMHEYISSWEQRMHDLEDPDLSVTKFDRAVVDVRDKSTHRLYELCANEKDETLFLKSQKVLDAVTDLKKEQQLVVQANAKDLEDHSSKMFKLEDFVLRENSELGRVCGSMSGEAILSPAEVQNAFVAVNTQIAKLSQLISNITADINRKKSELKGNNLLAKERALFSLFHLDQSHSLIQELRERIKSQQIK